MKKLGLISIALLLSTAVSANITRMLNVEANWKSIVCKQLENGGRSYYQKDYKDKEFSIAVTDSSVAAYEIYIDSTFVAACAFIAIDY